MAEAVEKPDMDEIRRVVSAALREDGAANDVTTSLLGIGSRTVRAALIARAPGVVAGIDAARAAFEETDSNARFEPRVGDGARVRNGDVLAVVEGSAAGVFAAERTALNFMQRLSGIATLSARFVERVEGTGAVILDTRKTTPLLRVLEKYAVRVGGARNHRFNLSDMVLIKDNHLQAVGGMLELAKVLGEKTAPVEIEVEVDSIADLRKLLGAPVGRIMLDNFSAAEAAEAVALVRSYREAHPEFAATIEISGGVGLDNVRDYAVAGADYISIGALTHSPPALDISLELIPGDRSDGKVIATEGTGDLLPREISRRARTRLLARRVYYLPEVDSTNRLAADLARQGEPEGTLVVADYQTAGRGRFERRWESPPGKDLLFSVILRPAASARVVLPVTLVFSAAVADTLGALTGRDAGVKWPNDVVIENKKICGILAEGSTSGGRTVFVVVGIGINVNMRAEELSRGLWDRSCSCAALTGHAWDRGEVLARVVTALERAYLEFAAEGFEELLGVYKSRLVILNRDVAIEREGSRTIARVVDVAPDGGLVVDTPDGRTTLYDHEVTMLRDQGA